MNHELWQTFNQYAYLIENPVNVRYLTGLNIEGFLLITDGQPFLFTDFRYIEEANQTLSFITPVLLTNKKEQVLEKVKNSAGLCLESNYQTLSAFKKYEDYGVKLIIDGSLDKKLSDLRLIKSEKEIAYIKKASEISEASLRFILPQIRPGVKERDIALKIEFFMREKGAESVSFPLIAIAGANTSKPHGEPGEYSIKPGDFVTLDIGCKWKGYCSDMTRTVAVSSVSDEQKKVYDTVFLAQKAALDKIRDGALCKEVDDAARNLIHAAGYKGCFGHSTGHGVGLEIHEAPNLSQKAEGILKENQMVTCEPGIYLNGRFGVRIEDLVCITRTGYENLNHFSKELIIL